MKRLQHIDAMRGIGILLVVLVHSLGYTRQLFVKPYATFFILENWLHTFIMPFFIFVSGYSFATIYPNGKEDEQRVTAYLWRLVQIYSVFGPSVILAKLMFSSFTIDKISPHQIVQNILLPDTTLWYIWFLMVMSLVMRLIRRYTSQSVSQSVSQRLFYSLLAGLVVLSFCYGGPLHLSGEPLAIQHLTSLPAFYVLGLMVAKKGLIGKIAELSVLKSGLLICLGLAYLMYYGHHAGQFSQHLIWHTVLRLGNGLVMTLLLTSIALKLKKTGLSCLISMGENSLYIYLLHTYILAVLIVLLRGLPFQQSPYFILLLLLTCSVASSLLMARLIRKIPPLDRLFTGKLFRRH